MPQLVYSDAFILCIYILVVLWFNLTLTIALERTRQRRMPHYYTPLVYLLPKKLPDLRIFYHREPVDAKAPIVFWYGAISNGAPKHRLGSAKDTGPVLADNWRIPVQPGEPDQIVIHIEPDGTQSDDQRNIKRIIDHLQQMSPKKDTKVAS